MNINEIENKEPNPNLNNIENKENFRRYEESDH